MNFRAQPQLALPLGAFDSPMAEAALKEHVEKIVSDVRGVHREALRQASAVPAHSNSPGTPGDTASDGAYLYVCTAQDTWQRHAVTGGAW